MFIVKAIFVKITSKILNISETKVSITIAIAIAANGDANFFSFFPFFLTFMTFLSQNTNW